MNVWKGIAFGVVLVSSVGVAQFSLPVLLPLTYEQQVFTKKNADGSEREKATEKKAEDTRRVVEHVPLPSAVKAIYMTSCVVGTPSFRDGLVAFVLKSEINSIVIDIKDFSGTLSYQPDSPEWQSAWTQTRCGARDMREFVAMLHQKGIYVIGRITVFQDPFYTAAHPEVAVKKKSNGAVWKDHKGLSFVDVGASAYWEHIVALSVDAYTIGFDELNFDYIRFPSDGDMTDIAFTHTGNVPKPVKLEEFFTYLSHELRNPSRYASVRHENTGLATATPYLSADLFGMTATNVDDLSIGQVLERTLPYFDFVSPMVYPSHYPKTFLGLSDPNKNVYRVVNYSMGEAVRRAGASTTPVDAFVHERIGTSTPALYKKPIYTIQKLRPWLQDFDYGGNYDIAEVQAQIKATYDTGLTSWMIWDPANRYTRGAFKVE